jgi:hypothetical protein
VGPYFDYSFGVNSTWHYTTDRLLLCILPGAAALAGGVLMVKAASRAAGAFGGWLAVLAGAWFVIGPVLSRTWEHGGGPIGAPLFGNTRQAAELIGYFYGLGALIIALAAFAVGRFASRPALALSPTPVVPAAAPSRGPRRLVGARWRRPGGALRHTPRSRVAPQETFDGPQSPSDSS